MKKYVLTIGEDDDIIEASERDYNGYKITDYNLPKPVENKLGFESSFRITSNYESMKENERKLNSEKRTLDSLIEQQNKMESDAKGFSAIITDGTNRIVDVRVIWAAEFSSYVASHIRYIATQRTK